MSEKMTDAREIVALIVRGCCESEPADPDHTDTVCINVHELESIVAMHVGVVILADDPSPSSCRAQQPIAQEEISATPNDDGGYEHAEKHHLSIYSVDFGNGETGRYVRLADFNRVCEAASGPVAEPAGYLISHPRHVMCRPDFEVSAALARDRARSEGLAYGEPATITPLYAAPPAQQEGADAAELARLRALVNSPELHDFARGVVLEASHQRERWGNDHDAGKTAADWFWLLGYLAGKALAAATAGDTEKALHHTISSAAALANWHGAILGMHNMRPGIDGEAALASPGAQGGES